MNADFFLQRVAGEFPQLEWREHRVLTHGWDHVVVVLDDKIVFRFPKNELCRAGLESEIDLLEYLKNRLPVGIPEYRYISTARSFVGYDMLRGSELTQARFRRLTAEQKETVATQLAGFISILHATPKHIIARCGVRAQSEEKLYEELARDTRRFVFPRLSRQEVQHIEGYFGESERALSHNYSNVLIHNDLTWEHILWDGRSKQTNIIDFSDAALGDPALDFSGLLEYGHEFAERVLNLYSGEKDAQILNRAQLYFKRMPLWIMKDSMHGFPCTFEQGYAMFKERFGV